LFTLKISHRTTSSTIEVFHQKNIVRSNGGPFLQGALQLLFGKRKISRYDLSAFVDVGKTSVSERNRNKSARI
jgi:hypothetical protein